MKYLLLLSTLLFSQFAQADRLYAGSQTITDLACNHVNSICWVEISGPAVGPEACSNTIIRWAHDSISGQPTLSLLLAAYMAKRTVTVRVSGDSCFPGYGNFTTLNSVSLAT